MSDTSTLVNILTFAEGNGLAVIIVVAIESKSINNMNKIPTDLIRYFDSI